MGNLIKTGLNPFIKIIMMQSLTVASLALGVLFFNQPIAIAIFLGGLIGCMVNFIFTQICFLAPGHAKKAKKILTIFYLAEVLKFILTALLLAMVVFSRKVLFMPMFVSYLVTYVSFSWIGLTYTSLSHTRFHSLRL